MDTFIVFHAPTGNTDLGHGIYRLLHKSGVTPHAQLLIRCELTSEALTICNWLNERPSMAWATVREQFSYLPFELTRVGRQLESEARRPTDVKIVTGRSAFGGNTVYHRIILSDADLASADQLFRDLSKFTPPSSAISYWQSGHGETIERILSDE